MKKSLLKITAAIATTAMLVGVGFASTKFSRYNAVETTAEDAVIYSATYTIDSASSVTSGGITPSGSNATFNNTYTSNKQQLISGKTATLTLSGYAGYTITGIELNMRSNSSAGAGTFSATAGTTTLASISSSTTFNKWFDNTSYGASFRTVNVTMSNNSYAIQSGEKVTIVISATTNSLYISDYTIKYCASGTTPSVVDATLEEFQKNFDASKKYNLQGTVTSTNGTNAYIQQGNYGAYIYKYTDSAFSSGSYTLKVGDKISISNATTKVYNGLREVTGGEIAYVSTGDTITAYSFSSYSDFSTFIADQNNQCALVNFSNLKYVSGTVSNSSSYSITVAFNDDLTHTFALRVDYTDFTSINSQMDDIAADNSTISLSNAVMGWFNGGQVNLVSGTTVTVTTNETPDPVDPVEPGESTTIAGTIADIADKYGWGEGTKHTSFDLNDVITVSTIEGGSNTGKYYTSNESWRLYAAESAYIKIDCSSGYELISLNITYASKNGGELENYTSNTDLSVSGTSHSINAVSGGNVQVTSISVTYKATSTTPTYGAVEFAQEFNSTVVCDNGLTAPSTTAWSSMATKFGTLDAAEKAKFTAETITDSDILSCVAKYDYIINKYGATNYANFMGRSVNSTSPAIKSIADDASGVTTIVTVTAIASITLVGGFALTRKRKHF